MISLSELIRQMCKDGDYGQQRKLIIRDYGTKRLIFQGKVKDLSSIILSDTKSQHEKIQNDSGFDLVCNLVFYRVCTALLEAANNDHTFRYFYKRADPDEDDITYVLYIYPCKAVKE